MRVTVDQDECSACGVCSDTCPEVFELDDEVLKIKCDPVPAEEEEACREAVEGCPTEAIKIEE